MSPREVTSLHVRNMQWGWLGSVPGLQRPAKHLESCPLGLTGPPWLGWLSPALPAPFLVGPGQGCDCPPSKPTLQGVLLKEIYFPKMARFCTQQRIRSKIPSTDASRFSLFLQGGLSLNTLVPPIATHRWLCNSLLHYFYGSETLWFFELLGFFCIYIHSDTGKLVLCLGCDFSLPWLLLMLWHC